MNKKQLTALFVGVLVVLLLQGCPSGGGGGGSRTDSQCPNTGTVSLSMGRESGGPWWSFNGKMGDPLALCVETKHAVITNIKNGLNPIMITHRDRTGRQLSTPTLQPNANTTSLAGLEVEGEWHAQFSGEQTEAPTAVGLWIEWKKP